MLGWFTARPNGWPSPLRLLGRVVLSTALVLGAAHVVERPAVRALIPVFRGVINLIDDNFVFNEIVITQDGASDVVRFRANLASPLTLDHRIVYPFGWNGTQEGGFQVTYTVGGVLTYSALMLIIVLAWPANGVKEWSVRLLLCAACSSVLLLIDVPTTVLAELWNGLGNMLGSSHVGGWMIWSRFLMGGGGFVIAMVMAAACVLLGRRISDFAADHGPSACWRMVSAREFDAFFRSYPGPLKVYPPFDHPARHRRLIDPTSDWPGGVVARCDWKRRMTAYRVRP